MSDGHGSTPDTPPGWASNQPPPYGNAPGSPWTAPGSAPGATAPQQPQPPYGPPGPPYQPGPYQQGPYGPPPHGHHTPPAMRPGIIPLRPLGLGDILDGAIKLIRSNPGAVLGLSAIAAALGAIPVAIGQALLLGQAGAAFDNPSVLENQEVGFLSQYGGTLISYAVQFIAVTLLTGVLTRILGRAVFGGKMTVGEAWKLTRGRVPTLFGLVIVGMVLLLLPLALVIAIITGLGAAGADLAALFLVGALVVLGFVAYSLFITTRLALAASVAVLERRGVVESLRRSWRLVSGGFWRTLGILLLTQIIAGVVALALSFPFTLAGTFVGMFGAGSTGSLIGAAVLISVGGTVSAMITYPFQAGVNGLLYADRRMRAEAFDLVLQTAAIEQQRQGWVHASADDLWDPSVTPAGAGRGAPWHSS
ncbi:glycerophosphoryl diester phosphodiesterase membrane domain-containing protein [Streptosporangium sp. NPDC003464]